MKWLFLFISIMTLLLFVGGPDYESHRIYQEAWDLGHIFLFACLSLLILKTNTFKNIPYNKLFIIIVLLTLCVGLLIEVLQVLVERTFEYKDVLSDLIGTIIGFIIHLLFNKKYLIGSLKLSLFTILLLSLVSSSKLIIVLIDEVNMRKEFPTLAKFSTPLHLSRWDVNSAHLDINDSDLTQEELLEVTFMPEKYPDITLLHFMTNWTSYQYISFKLFNTQTKSLNINFKIYDKYHAKHNYKYSDRFNRVFNLKPGWNKIKITLAEVINSPKTRKMDITEIKSVSLFLLNVKQPIKIYLGAIELN